MLMMRLIKNERYSKFCKFLELKQYVEFIILK